MPRSIPEPQVLQDMVDLGIVEQSFVCSDKTNISSKITCKDIFFAYKKCLITSKNANTTISPEKTCKYIKYFVDQCLLD